ncbi:MAG: biopolymer transporter ExbD [Melioribacteraceae bacterium]|nr:biopolymer transporter ExbD [Melioribacteraceae bacterium]
MLMKKKKDRGADIEAGSMADITFLLLLFFLVTTTIDVDTGIGMTLPEYQEDVEVAPISKDRMAAIMVNEAGQVLLGGEIIAIPQIKDNLKERIKSKLDLPANKKLIVSIKAERTTNYNMYIQTLDQVKGAYQEMKDELSRGIYGKEYRELSPDEQGPIKDKVRETISIAEPEKVGN